MASAAAGGSTSGVGNQDKLDSPLAGATIRKHDHLRAGRAIDNLDDVSRVGGHVFPVAERAGHAAVPNFKTFVVHRRSYTVSLPPKTKPWPPERAAPGLGLWSVSWEEPVQAIAILYRQAFEKPQLAYIFREEGPSGLMQPDLLPYFMKSD